MKEEAGETPALPEEGASGLDSAHFYSHLA
jgi:hypothetical protein